MNSLSTIFVVDDDPAIRRALVSAGGLLSLPVVCFASAQEFLQAYDASQPGCLVLDIKMPEMTGLELQQKLAFQGMDIPIIIISGHADVRTTVEVMTRGAITLLEKPFRLEELLTQIRKALEVDAVCRSARSENAKVHAQLSQLTPKEFEVIKLIVSGKTNKQIASALHLSVRAVEDRRARLMKKLQVRSLAELVQIWSLRQ